MKKTWLKSCLINIIGWPNKFILNNCFGKTIIILNKKNLNPSANAKSIEFLCKTVLQNMLLLWNSKEALLQAIGSTLYGNCYLIVGSYLNIYYLVKLFTKEAVFYEQLRRDIIGSNLPNLFANSSASLAREVLLTKYITSP